jgi:flagellar hook-length control protein FliK
MASISKEMANAAMIQAMLSGEGTDGFAEETDNEVDETEDENLEEINGIKIDIDFDEEDKKKKAKAKRARVHKKTDEEIAAEKKAADKLPECDFADIKKSEKFIVVLNSHIIPYKEQEWPIDERKVPYEVSRVDSVTTARKIVRQMYGDKLTSKQLEDATSGATRYMEVRVFNETVPYRATCLAYIEIKPGGKNIIKPFRNDMEACHISCTDVLKDLKKVIKAAVTYKE